MKIQTIYDYAKLATLSYVDLSKYPKESITPGVVIAQGATDNNPGKTERIPTALGIQMFSPGGILPDGTVVSADLTGQWTVLDPYFKITKGVSFAFSLEQPCHVAHALS